MKRLNTKSLGFTLIELMIAMLLGLILMGGVILVFFTGKQAYQETTAISHLQENITLINEILSRDIRNAGSTLSPIWENWSNQKIYPVGSIVLPTLTKRTGLYFEAINSTSPGKSGIAEPLWPSSVNAEIQDLGITWIAKSSSTHPNPQDLCDGVPIVGAWAYQSSQIKGQSISGSVAIRPAPNGFCYIASGIGTTGTVEPIWPVVDGQVVVDGDITWRAKSQLMPGLTKGSDSSSFTVSYYGESDCLGAIAKNGFISNHYSLDSSSKKLSCNGGLIIEGISEFSVAAFDKSGNIDEDWTDPVSLQFQVSLEASPSGQTQNFTYTFNSAIRSKVLSKYNE